MVNLIVCEAVPVTVDFAPEAAGAVPVKVSVRQEVISSGETRTVPSEAK